MRYQQFSMRFFWGKIDHPLDCAPDVALSWQEDRSYIVSWRRPQRKCEMPAIWAVTARAGLGDSTAPVPKAPARGKQQKESETV